MTQITVSANVDSDLLFRPAAPGISYTDISVAQDEQSTLYFRLPLSDGTVLRYYGSLQTTTPPGQPPVPLDSLVERVVAEVGGVIVVDAVPTGPNSFADILLPDFGADVMAPGAAITDTRLAGDAGSRLGATLRGGG
jgi:hypothetical protein